MEGLQRIKIVRERDWHVCKSGAISFFENNAYCCLVVEHITEPLALISTRTYRPKIKDAVNPYYIVTFGDYNETYKIERGFFGCQIRKL